MPKMKKAKKLTWKKHRERWQNCDRCELCETRKRIVLLRGRVPCSVLFVGEAPGASEDVLGRPFMGPAGHLLDNIISNSEMADVDVAFTNLVGCIPIDPNEGRKVKQPHKEHVKACEDRLLEVIQLCKPWAIVALGDFTFKTLDKMDLDGLKVVKVMHPAGILRMDQMNKPLAIQQAEITLTDLVEELFPDA